MKTNNMERKNGMYRIEERDGVWMGVRCGMAVWSFKYKRQAMHWLETGESTPASQWES